MFKNTLKSNAPAIAFALAALAATVPSAALADQVRTERVKYGDLNLASVDGVKALDRRLDRAVKRVCGSYEATDPSSRREARECEQEAHAAISDQRTFAIAQATGQQNGKRWADNSSGQPTAVSFSE